MEEQTVTMSDDDDVGAADGDDREEMIRFKLQKASPVMASSPDPDPYERSNSVFHKDKRERNRYAN